MGPENFKRQVEFLQKFVENVNLGSRKIRLGVIQVSNKERTEVIFGFDSSQNPLDIQYLLKNMPFYNKPERYVGEALKKVYTSVSTVYELHVHSLKKPKALSPTHSIAHTAKESKLPQPVFFIC